MARIDAFRTYQSDMAAASRDLIRLPLYPYQVAWANYVLEVVRERRTEIVVVEMSRQSGKNETSAQLEVVTLAAHGRAGGSIVKTAPTWQPQIVNSKERFEMRAASMRERLPFLEFKPREGYKYRCGRASISFLSAQPQSNVVGDTASLLMEIDEAQDTNRDKFNKEFSPMRASTGAPLVAYGTTWTDDTLLEDFKRAIQEGGARGRIYRITPDVIGESNPHYWAFVESEIARLGGRDHPYIRTQYFLEPLATAGRMLKADHLELMVGAHPRQATRTNEAQIVAGLDFAGADETPTMISLGSPSGRDSVALSIGSVEWLKLAAGLEVPFVRILARYEWVNVNPVTLHSVLYELLSQTWKADRVHCDATGIGATSTAFLASAINKNNRERIHGVTFDGAWKAHTELAFQYLASVMSGRLKDYLPSGFDPLKIASSERPVVSAANPLGEQSVNEHGWWQRGHAKLEARPGQRVRAYVPSAEGHDDILTSELLMVDAAYQVGQPQRLTSGSVNFYGR